MNGYPHKKLIRICLSLVLAAILFAPPLFAASENPASPQETLSKMIKDLDSRIDASKEWIKDNKGSMGKEVMGLLNEVKADLTEKQKEGEEAKSLVEGKSLVEEKTYLSNVFFGGFAGLFTLVAIIFLGKFFINILGSSLRFILGDRLCDWALETLGGRRKHIDMKDRFHSPISASNKTREKK